MLLKVLRFIFGTDWLWQCNSRLTKIGMGFYAITGVKNAEAFDL